MNYNLSKKSRYELIDGIAIFVFLQFITNEFGLKSPRHRLTS